MDKITGAGKTRRFQPFDKPSTLKVKHSTGSTNLPVQATHARSSRAAGSAVLGRVQLSKLAHELACFSAKRGGVPLALEPVRLAALLSAIPSVQLLHLFSDSSGKSFLLDAIAKSIAEPDQANQFGALQKALNNHPSLLKPARADTENKLVQGVKVQAQAQRRARAAPGSSTGARVKASGEVKPTSARNGLQAGRAQPVHLRADRNEADVFVAEQLLPEAEQLLDDADRAYGSNAVWTRLRKNARNNTEETLLLAATLRDVRARGGQDEGRPLSLTASAQELAADFMLHKAAFRQLKSQIGLLFSQPFYPSQDAVTRVQDCKLVQDDTLALYYSVDFFADQLGKEQSRDELNRQFIASSLAVYLLASPAAVCSLPLDEQQVLQLRRQHFPDLPIRTAEKAALTLATCVKLVNSRLAQGGSMRDKRKLEQQGEWIAQASSVIHKNLEMEAALEREHAALEREHAALEREQAALEREQGAREREELQAEAALGSYFRTLDSGQEHDSNEFDAAFAAAFLRQFGKESRADILASEHGKALAAATVFHAGPEARIDQESSLTSMVRRFDMRLDLLSDLIDLAPRVGGGPTVSQDIHSAVLGHCMQIPDADLDMDDAQFLQMADQLLDDFILGPEGK